MNPSDVFPPRNILVPTDMGAASRSAAKSSGDLRADLIVMGAERKTSEPGEIFSSTTTGVMQLAIVPLLVVPRNV